MAPEPGLVGLFVPPLNRAGIEYMVTGGFAAIVYGHPRLTLDLDLVIRMRPADAARFAALWPPVEFYCPPVEALALEAARAEHGHFNVIHAASAMRADVYLAAGGALEHWALARRVAHRISGEEVQVAPIEYVVARKLWYARLGGAERHLQDVARMLEVRGTTVNLPALERWIAELGVEAEWSRARALEGNE